LLEIAAGQFELGFDSKALEAISNAGAGAAEINVSRLDPAETAEISSEAAEKSQTALYSKSKSQAEIMQ
jgi:hypothetical protein